jgi:hypothetical protein
MTEGKIELQSIISSGENSGLKLFIFMTMLVPLAGVIVAFTMKKKSS